MKSLRVNDHDIAYIEVGSGRPLVCVHGSLNDFRCWSAMLGPLSRSHRVMVMWAYIRASNPNRALLGTVEVALPEGRAFGDSSPGVALHRKLAFYFLGHIHSFCSSLILPEVLKPIKSARDTLQFKCVALSHEPITQPNCQLRPILVTHLVLVRDLYRVRQACLCFR